jgi:hypothetical protein
LLALRRRPAGGDVKPPRAALAEDRRGERMGKGARDASGGDQEDVPDSVPWPLMGGAGCNAVSVEIKIGGIETGDSNDLREGPGGYPLTGQVVSGVKAA